MGAQDVDPRKGRDKGSCSGWGVDEAHRRRRVAGPGEKNPAAVSWLKDGVLGTIHAALGEYETCRVTDSTDAVESSSASPCFLTRGSSVLGLFLLSHCLQGTGVQTRQPMVLATSPSMIRISTWLCRLPGHWVMI
jgi:hypothetical protein